MSLCAWSLQEPCSLQGAEAWRSVSNELKRVWRLWLEINNKELFKGLQVCKPETQLGNTQSIPKKKEKLRVFTGKRIFLRRLSSALLASGLVQDIIF